MSAAKAQKLWDLVEQFAGYGFNKSHSAAYALVAYHTAYLKTHYPVEFMSALLTAEIGNQDKLTRYLAECKDMGIGILPPDVNSSDLVFTPAGNAIRFGLTAIKNVGPTAIESVLAARQKLGRFDNLVEFCEHVDLRLLNKRVLESLIKAGAFDSLGVRAHAIAGGARPRHGDWDRSASGKPKAGSMACSWAARTPRLRRLSRCPMCRNGPRRSAWRRKRKSWGST